MTAYFSSVKKSTLAVHIFTLIAALSLVMIGITVYGADPAGLCLFVVFFLCYVLIPGYALTRLVRIRTPHLSTTLSFSLFTGWAFIVLVYFLSDFLPTDILLAAAGPAVTVLFLIHTYKNRSAGGSGRNTGEHIAGIPAPFCIFFLLVLAYALLSTQYQYLSPELCDFVGVNPDKAYHMGLVNSLSHDYPLESPWIQGRFINYHIFTEVMYSVPVRLFGMESDFLLFSCGPYLTAFSICTTMYSFFAELSHKPSNAGWYCLLVMLANPYVVRNYYRSIAFVFAITNDNTSGYGIVAAMAFVVLLKYFFKAYDENEGRVPVRISILLTAYIMLVTGIKGPMGIVLLAAFWGTMFLGWILRQTRFNLIITSLSLTAGFAIIYLTILGAKGRGTATGGNSLISFANITDICFWKKPLIELLKSMSVPTPLRLGILMLVFVVLFLSVFFIPFCIGYIRELILVLSRKKPFVFHEVIVYAAFLVGFIAMFLLRYSGHSQIYFGLLSLFFAPLIAFWYLEDVGDYYKKASGSRRILPAALYTVMALTLVFTTYTLLYSYYNMIPVAIENADPAQERGLYTSMSNDEYQAMEWIEDNTPKDALLATDRYYSVPLEEYSFDNRWDNRFFLYAAYSNRFCYIAGSGYNLGTNEWPVRLEMIKKNSELYDAGNEERGDEARELGVDYVVVSKRFTDLPDLSDSDYEKCYENTDVEIYQIRPAS